MPERRIVVKETQPADSPVSRPTGIAALAAA
jgi:hypothetical protein